MGIEREEFKQHILASCGILLFLRCPFVAGASWIESDPLLNTNYGEFSIDNPETIIAITLTCTLIPFCAIVSALIWRRRHLFPLTGLHPRILLANNLILAISTLTRMLMWVVWPSIGPPCGVEFVTLILTIIPWATNIVLRGWFLLFKNEITAHLNHLSQQLELEADQRSRPLGGHIMTVSTSGGLVGVQSQSLTRPPTSPTNEKCPLLKSKGHLSQPSTSGSLISPTMPKTRQMQLLALNKLTPRSPLTPNSNVATTTLNSPLDATPLSTRSRQLSSSMVNGSPQAPSLSSLKASPVTTASDQPQSTQTCSWSKELSTMTPVLSAEVSSLTGLSMMRDSSGSGTDCETTVTSCENRRPPLAVSLRVHVEESESLTVPMPNPNTAIGGETTVYTVKVDSDESLETALTPLSDADSSSSDGNVHRLYHGFGGWFVRNRHYTSTAFLAKVYALFASSQLLIILLFFFVDPDTASVGASPYSTQLNEHFWHAPPCASMSIKMWIVRISLFVELPIMVFMWYRMKSKPADSFGLYKFLGSTAMVGSMACLVFTFTLAYWPELGGPTVLFFQFTIFVLSDVQPLIRSYTIVRDRRRIGSDGLGTIGLMSHKLKSFLRIHTVLNHARAYAAFHDFTRKEFSSENVAFWSEVKRYGQFVGQLEVACPDWPRLGDEPSHIAVVDGSSHELRRDRSTTNGRRKSHTVGREGSMMSSLDTEHTTHVTSGREANTLVLAVPKPCPPNGSAPAVVGLTRTEAKYDINVTSSPAEPSPNTDHSTHPSSADPPALSTVRTPLSPTHRPQPSSPKLISTSPSPSPTTTTAALVAPIVYSASKLSSLRSEALEAKQWSLKIFRDYLAPGAPFEVNVPHDIVKDISAQVKLITDWQPLSNMTTVTTASGTFTLPSPPPVPLAGLYRAANQNIIDLMQRDSFRRFVASSTFTEMIKDIERELVADEERRMAKAAEIQPALPQSQLDLIEAIEKEAAISPNLIVASHSPHQSPALKGHHAPMRSSWTLSAPMPTLPHTIEDDAGEGLHTVDESRELDEPTPSHPHTPTLSPAVKSSHPTTPARVSGVIHHPHPSPTRISLQRDHKQSQSDRRSTTTDTPTHSPFVHHNSTNAVMMTEIHQLDST